MIDSSNLMAHTVAQRRKLDAGVVKSVNTTDLKSVAYTMACGFNSRRPHQPSEDLKSNGSKQRCRSNSDLRNKITHKVKLYVLYRRIAR